MKQEGFRAFWKGAPGLFDTANVVTNFYEVL